jgi:hypothetical protein
LSENYFVIIPDPGVFDETTSMVSSANAFFVKTIYYFDFFVTGLSVSYNFFVEFDDSRFS